ncbi:hypothetical protein HK101_000799, partial [Irineochytrium annulatum]
RPRSRSSRQARSFSFGAAPLTGGANGRPQLLQQTHGEDGGSGAPGGQTGFSRRRPSLPPAPQGAPHHARLTGGNDAGRPPLDAGVGAYRARSGRNASNANSVGGGSHVGWLAPVESNGGGVSGRASRTSAQNVPPISTGAAAVGAVGVGNGDDVALVPVVLAVGPVSPVVPATPMTESPGSAATDEDEDERRREREEDVGMVTANQSIHGNVLFGLEEEGRGE